MINEFSKQFGENLRTYRKDASLLQRDLAEQMNVSDATISNWERGQASPGLEQLKHLCNVLNCTSDELLGVKSGEPIYDENLGIKWQILPPLAIAAMRTEEIQASIELFTLIAKKNYDFLDIQNNTRRFAGYTETGLRQLLKVGFLSGAVQIIAVERDHDKEEKLRKNFAPYLRQCIVAATNFKSDSLITSTIHKETVAFLAARHSIDMLPYNGEVALSGGTTISRFVDLLPPASPILTSITWLPLLVSKEQLRRTGLSANSVITRMIYRQPGAKGLRLSFLVYCAPKPGQKNQQFKVTLARVGT
jgi:transcriptional regulator with XRE-family HTH domain